MPPAIPRTAPTRHRLTVDDYHRMGEVGILPEGLRTELLDGELIDMAPIGAMHAAVVNEVAEQFIRAMPPEIIVSVQNPVVLDAHSEPQPDLMVLRPSSDRYRSALPTAADVLLLIEVADTSLHHDRHRKIPLYARHGIPEVWILDLAANRLHRHRDPDPDTGTYRLVDSRQHGTLRPREPAELVLDLDRLW